MTQVQKLIDALKKCPSATNEELGEIIGSPAESVKAMIYRLRDSGRCELNYVTTDGEKKREITVFDKAEKPNYKKEVLEQLITQYLEDFNHAELFAERVEIGKLILRILEKL